MFSISESHVLGIFLITALCNLTVDGAINIILIPDHPQPHQTVTLSVLGISKTIRSFTWYKGLEPTAGNQILSYIPSASPQQTEGSVYFPAANGQPNGSLVITNFLLEYKGNYIVQIQTDTLEQASTQVNGFVPLRIPSIGLLTGALLLSTLVLL